MRNQLAVAMANLEACVDGKLEPTPQRIGAVLQALSSLDALIDDLYASSSAEPVSDAMHARPRTIDVCSLISREVMGLDASAADAGVHLEVRSCAVRHDECTSFFGDPVRIAQIVKNVVLNAIRYTPRGGTMLVDCHRGPGRLELVVSDEGPGVSSGDAERLYEAGYRGSAAVASGIAGSGLGLSVVKRLVEDQGGAVELMPTARGASFLIALPGRPLTDCRSCGVIACERHASSAVST